MTLLVSYLLVGVVLQSLFGLCRFGRLFLGQFLLRFLLHFLLRLSFGRLWLSLCFNLPRELKLRKRFRCRLIGFKIELFSLLRHQQMLLCRFLGAFNRL